MRAWRDIERCELGIFNIGIAVWGGGSILAKPWRIEPVELVLKLGTGHPQFALHASDQIETTVQVDHAGAAGGLMKPVNILGQQYFGLAHRL